MSQCCSSGSMSLASLSHSSEESDSDCSVAALEKSHCQNETPIKLFASRNIMEYTEIATTAVRLKISGNLMTMLLKSLIKVCGGDVNKFNLSKSTARLACSSSRLQTSQE